MLGNLFKKDSSEKNSRFEFKVNKTVKLSFEQDAKHYNLTTRIQDVFDDSIKIYSPTVDGRLVSIEKGRELDVKVIDLSGVYSFSTPVTGREGGAIPSLTLRKPKKVLRQQRRKNPRVRACLSVYCELLESDTEIDLEVDRKLLSEDEPLWTQDISQSGICVTAAAKFPINQLVRMRITLIKPEKVIFAKARILRVIEDSIYGQYLNCAEFEEISEYDCSAISQFIKNNYSAELA